MPDQSRRNFVLFALSGATLKSGAANASMIVDAPRSATRGKPLIDKEIKAAASQAEATAIPPFANVVLNRMGFGPTGNDVEDFNALGTTDDERLQAYVEQQLDWSSIDDTVLESRISDPAYTTLNETLAEQWQDHRVDGNNYGRPLDEMEHAAFLRAVFSKRQLLEFLADFWHNHFNIYGRDTYARPTWTSWDRDVIRPPVSGLPRPSGMHDGHFMGNFRQMLELSAKHPAMIYYLDNYVNGRADPNENYAREIIELHTLGAINYVGPNPQPGDINVITTDDYPDGINDKYSDLDVYEAMYFLTGWNVEDGSNPSGEENTGEWYFVPDWHDQGQKQLLGLQWEANRGLSEIYEMLDLLAFHPGTAQYIALKLCTRFVSDDPPQSLVDKVAQTFFENRRTADQLEQVYQTLLLSDEFKDTATWGGKLKRPFETIVSGMRACGADFTIRPDDSESSTFMYYMRRGGQRPFHWRGPDGYPDKRSFWEGGGSLINTWRTLDWLIDENVGGNDPDLIPITETTVAGLTTHTANSLAEFWLKQILKWQPAGGWAGTELHSILSEFMSTRPDSDEDPSLWPSDYPIEDIQSNSWPYYWNERLRGMVKLILATPEFMQR